LDIGDKELRIETNGHLSMGAIVDVDGLQIDGVTFDMDGHNAVVDQHTEFFSGVTITDADYDLPYGENTGDPDTVVYKYSVNQELRSLPADQLIPTNTTLDPGVFRVNDHFSVHEPGAPIMPKITQPCLVSARV
jgi:hypothetical protein